MDENNIIKIYHKSFLMLHAHEHMNRELPKSLVYYGEGNLKAIRNENQIRQPCIFVAAWLIEW